MSITPSQDISIVFYWNNCSKFTVLIHKELGCIQFSIMQLKYIFYHINSNKNTLIISVWFRHGVLPVYITVFLRPHMTYKNGGKRNKVRKIVNLFHFNVNYCIDLSIIKSFNTWSIADCFHVWIFVFVAVPTRMNVIEKS